MRFVFADGAFCGRLLEWAQALLRTTLHILRKPADQALGRRSTRRRGENISSLEVEQVLDTHPAVAAVAVYAVPSELAEDEVMASVMLRTGQPVDPAELASWCAPRLAAFAIPRYIDVVAELALTENGKVRKAALRERGVTAGTWDGSATQLTGRRASPGVVASEAQPIQRALDEDAPTSTGISERMPGSLRGSGGACSPAEAGRAWSAAT